MRSVQERVVREIRTLRAMWRVLETEPRQFLTGHEEGNLGYMPRKSLRATAPVPDPTDKKFSRQLATHLASVVFRELFYANRANLRRASRAYITSPIASLTVMAA